MIGRLNADTGDNPQNSVPVETQLQHLGQKYMGIRPENHVDRVFNSKVVQTDGAHPVPVSNFLNAQCGFLSSLPCCGRPLAVACAALSPGSVLLTHLP
jgi:hypothetical protein